jgi:hypothetical protein
MVNWGDQSPPMPTGNLNFDAGTGRWQVGATHKYTSSPPPPGNSFTVTVTITNPDNGQMVGVMSKAVVP